VPVAGEGDLEEILREAFECLVVNKQSLKVTHAKDQISHFPKHPYKHPSVAADQMAYSPLPLVIKPQSGIIEAMRRDKMMAHVWVRRKQKGWWI
jgi:hypothetical protein